MRKIFILIAVIFLTSAFTLGINFLLPQITKSTVTLIDNGASLSEISNTKVKVTHFEGCASSPCPSPKIIFDGQTDERGNIELSDWHLSNLNNCGYADVVYDCYSFELEGYGKDYSQIERGGKAFFVYFKKL